VVTTSGEGIPGASVYLLNTLDGTSTDALGNFSFVTKEVGDVTVIVSAIGFVKQQVHLRLDKSLAPVTFVLKEEVSQLNEVVISAGSMEANNDHEVAVLKPMDIYTNAGAGGDIVGAIQTLPGTQRVAEQTGLFVRGGDANESLVIIDGMSVQNAFFSNIPGVAQRSRFTPFQFKGVSFSSGGYSVRYGQALSSILELNTLDLPEKSTISANINMSGIALTSIKRWKSNGAEITAYYNNMAPFYKIANTNFNFYHVPSGGGVSAKWSAQNKNGGIIKSLIKRDYYESGTEIPDPFQPGATMRFGLKNQNTYLNTSYRQLFNEKMLFYTAASASINEDKTRWGDFPVVNNDWRMQWRGEGTRFVTAVFNLMLGSEIQRYQYTQNFDTVRYRFNETLTAMYLECEWKLGKRFAIKPGVRAEHSAMLAKESLAPRVSMAFKTGEYSQVSLASGMFYQTADKRYLLRQYHPDFQYAVHYLANYQWINHSRSFRIEGYYKSYHQLIREINASYNPNPYRVVYGPVNNSGSGYAQGVDVFWRDQKTIKNFDYWLAYSYVDTKRLYANLIAKATPDFVSNHNLNLTAKYLIESIQMNVGATFSFTSGRTYYNPHDGKFLGSHGPAYQNLALNVSYLTTIGKWFAVIYANVDNVWNYKNVLGYRYSPDGQNRYKILPPLYRAFFVGANISLTSFKKDEL
jgi:outer membrane cobalamin receptor